MPRLQHSSTIWCGASSPFIRQGAHVGILMDTCPDAVIAIATHCRDSARWRCCSDGDLATAVPGVRGCRHHHRTRPVGGGRGHRRPSADVGEHPVPRERPGGRFGPAERVRHRPAALVSAQPGAGTGCRLRVLQHHRWAPRRQKGHQSSVGASAFATAAAAALDRGDTIYCLAPLHHPSALMVGLGGALAGGSHRLGQGRRPGPVRRRNPPLRSHGRLHLGHVARVGGRCLPELHERHPIRLFIGAGMPTGLWHKVTSRFAPARVLEFYASTEGTRCWPTSPVSRSDPKGRPLPGSSKIELGAYDATQNRFVEDDHGFVRRCADGEVGVLLAKPRSGLDAASVSMRSVFALDFSSTRQKLDSSTTQLLNQNHRQNETKCFLLILPAHK